jgi:hypothetical protein
MECGLYIRRLFGEYSNYYRAKKEQALEQFVTYLKNRDHNGNGYGLFWVLRVLFDVSSQQGFPPIKLGQPSIPLPAELSKLPRFPIVMVRDIPFLVVRGYSLGGLPEPVETHVAYFRVYGTLRQGLLVPPASLEGVEEDFLRLWKSAYGNMHTSKALEMVRVQIARLSNKS